MVIACNGAKVQRCNVDCVQFVKDYLTFNLTFIDINNFGRNEIMANFATDKGTNNIKT